MLWTRGVSVLFVGVVLVAVVYLKEREREKFSIKNGDIQNILYQAFLSTIALTET